MNAIKGHKGFQKTHGHGATRKRKGSNLYDVWAAMKRRCSADVYSKWYSSKGIKVCDEWKNSFPIFRDWAIENGYGPGMSIDRIDPDSHYQPENCRWIPGRENFKRASDRRWDKHAQEYLLGFISSALGEMG